jgi:hypothetical protein
MTSGTLTERLATEDSALQADADSADEADEPAADAAADADEDGTLTTDTLFELLKNSRRRDAIGFLKANDGRTTLSDTAEHIAARENGVTVEELSSPQRKRVYISLYQSHLPKMDRAGVVRFDKDRGTVELTERATQLFPYLDATRSTGGTGPTGPADGATGDGEARPTTHRLPVPSVALAGVGVAGLAGVAGVPGFDLLTPVLWTVVCAVSLLVGAVLPVVTE